MDIKTEWGWVWCGRSQRCQSVVGAAVLFSQSTGRELQKGLRRGCGTLPRDAPDHCIVRVDDVAFPLIVLHNTMSGSERSLTFRFSSLDKLFACSPCHTMKDDPCSILWRW